MTYPIRQPPDDDPAYAWTPAVRAAIAAANDHQARLVLVEAGLGSIVKTAAYTFAGSDFRPPVTVQEFVYNSTSAGAFTLPTGVAGGLVALVHQFGTGQLTITPGTGVTLLARGNAFKLAGQYAVAEIRSTSPGTFLLVGDIVA